MMSTELLETDAERTRIGPYLLEGEIGRGAHGVVYRARHRDRPETLLALKVVESRGNRDRLLVEPEILSRLAHPNIVRLEDYFPDGENLVVVLEYVEGQDAKSWSEERGPLESHLVRAFLRQMASALEHAHAVGVLHRDIKLSNVLVQMHDGRPRFVLTDFGISRLSEGIQVTRHTGGTYQFMAPEQLRGRPGQASDLWALGVAAYALWTGRLPFEGRTLEELSQSVFYRTPTPPSQLRPTTDDDLEALLYRLLEKSLNERTASAGELLEQLGAPSPDALPKAAPAPTAGTFEHRVKQRIRRWWLVFWLSALLSAGPLGLVPQVLTLIAAFWFYQAQRGTMSRGRGIVVTLLALGAMAAAWPLSLGWLALIQGPLVEWSVVMVGVIMICGAVFTPLAIHSFTQARRLSREMAMRRAIADSASRPDEQLQQMEAFVRAHPEDANFYQRYVETLLAQSRPKDAAVEARLLLDEDPYSPGANLLLAHAYYQLGLYDQCVAVANAYLAVSGYCFEFTELKARCTQAVEVAA